MALVDGMAEEIERRRVKLGLTKQALVERTGLSRPGLGRLLRGERHDYQERTTIPVCRVLGWTPDSIERLMNGEPPTLDPAAAVNRPDEWVPLAQHIELAAEVRRIGQELVVLGAAVERLRRGRGRESI